MTISRTKKIRTLNDEFRRTMKGGTVVLTPGIRGLPEEDQTEILNQIKCLEDFPQTEDPNQHHGFGCVEHNARKAFFKIDCYDRKLMSASADPANEKTTHRVLTVFLGHEY